MTMTPWWNQFLSDRVDLMLNGNVATLVERAIQKKEGTFSSEGALVIKTGKFTGRATEDKYVVRDDYSEGRIDWANSINSMTPDQFDEIKNEFVKKFNNNGKTIYATERSVGADSHYALGVRVLTPNASHSLFARNMFREPLNNPELGHFTILHYPDLPLNAKEHGLKSPTVIAINFTTREILIAGTGYAGEMKKAVFSVMNTLLPDLSVLPMHSGANVDKAGRVTVFFGLSGTGKTTLSTDLGKTLIGDDEHGISPEGIFNLEGGCYAKTYNLTEKGEPQIFRAVNRFGAILENVELDKDHRPRFNSKALTENGRGSYPLSFISDASTTGRGPFPSNIFFLSADAMGVLPAVAKLDPDQAIYYFLSGYTAKLAGTEIGLAGIKATFSHCFGAPFMMRHPMVYAQLLKKYLTEHPVNVWLINTGWYGGAYGIGKRYELSTTREIIRSIQKGLSHDLEFRQDPFFGLKVPKSIPGVENKFLDTRSLWASATEYDQTAAKLKTLFTDNFKKFPMTIFSNDLSV